jgi:hypothetical protein
MKTALFPWCMNMTLTGRDPEGRSKGMGHPNPSTITEEVRADQREEESHTQLEFSIVITALVALLITLGYLYYLGL